MLHNNDNNDVYRDDDDDNDLYRDHGDEEDDVEDKGKVNFMNMCMGMDIGSSDGFDRENNEMHLIPFGKLSNVW